MIYKRRTLWADPPWHGVSFHKMPFTRQTWSTTSLPSTHSSRQTDTMTHSLHRLYSLCSVAFWVAAKLLFVTKHAFAVTDAPNSFSRWAHGITAVLYHKYSVVKSLLCLIIQAGSTTKLSCLKTWNFSTYHKTHDQIDAKYCQESTCAQPQ